MVSPEFIALSRQQDKIRNFSIIAHVDHGKTTFADNLLHASGALSEEMIGRALQLDDKPDEIERGITIDASYASFVYNKHLFHFVDTPGHIDFEHEVSYALRQVEGAIVVVCAVEGIMPQTELAIKKAIYEGVTPILFINKIDLLLDRDAIVIQQRISDLILAFNTVIDYYKGQKKVSLPEGTVLFGSAKDGWAASYPFMQKNKLTFSKIKSNYTLSWLHEHCPLHDVVLYHIVESIGPPTSREIAKNLKGTVFFVSKVEYIENQFVAIGRVCSGVLRTHQVLKNNASKVQISELRALNLPRRSQISEMSEGNICQIIGIDVKTGDVLYEDAQPTFRPVITQLTPTIKKAIEPLEISELERLRQLVAIIEHEDPYITSEIDPITGELFISGLGELHLDVTIKRIIEKGMLLRVSEPLLMYKQRGAHILEPVQEILLVVPHESVGQITELLGTKKALIQDIAHEEYFTKITARITTEQFIGFPALFISALHGKGTVTNIAIQYEKVPAHKIEEVKKRIAKRTAILEKE